MDKKEILIKTGLKYCAVTGPMDFYQLSMSLKEIKKKLEAEKEEMKEFGGEAITLQNVWKALKACS